MSTKQIAVIGLGRFGASVARTLRSLGHEVLGIDSDESLVEMLSEELTHAVCCDCTDEESLRSLGLRNFDCAVVAIGRNVQASILATVLLKELGVPHVVAKASDDLHGRTLGKVGADKVVYAERDMGVRVAHSLLTGSTIDFLELTPDYLIQEMTAPPKLVGLTLRELNLRARFGVNVMALKEGEQIHPAPRADDVVKPGDVLVLLGTGDGLHRLERSLQEK